MGVLSLENANSRKVGVLHEIPSLVGLWIFSGTTQQYNALPALLHV